MSKSLSANLDHPTDYYQQKMDSNSCFPHSWNKNPYHTFGPQNPEKMKVLGPKNMGSYP